MYLSEQLQQKWQPVLDHPELAAIKDPYKKAVTAMVLENQQQA
ncbi:MAG: ATP-binding protein, partial [Proteobacteria bacterium]|nr:ATP-binding protein [Pseudomonadota bacterium]